MKVEITYRVKPISIFGAMDPTDLEDPQKEVHIDGKRIDEKAEKLVLYLLGCMTEDYAKTVLESMKKWGIK